MSIGRRVILVQLPIPPLGGTPIQGNVPLAAAYLKMMAEQRGLQRQFEIQLLAPGCVNAGGDLALLAAILEREPWMVGFSCYLWNIDRTLWLAERLKQQRPELVVIVGGPEVTPDNAWVLNHPAVDFCVVGEGEQTFVELLGSMSGAPSKGCGDSDVSIAGLHRRGQCDPLIPRRPIAQLDAISSPYLHGILDAADEQMLLLETIRGCVFKCKFCYYPKSYDGLYFLSAEKTLANLRHAQQRGVKEVVLLDPTLNQRRDFAAFLQLLIAGNPQRQFKYFGELRAEGITPEIAALLREANFPEVEIGLQSIDPLAMDLMDRQNNLKAYERGVRAMLAEGIDVKVDLIIGLPGDTSASVRRGMRYLRETGLYSRVQVFNLAVLPGTAFRQEAAELGLHYSPRTPYYVTVTPTLTTAELYDLMAEAQEIFDVDFDPLPEPQLALNGGAAHPTGWHDQWRVSLDDPRQPFDPPPPDQRTCFFTLWVKAADFQRREAALLECVRRLLADNPHTTLQIVLEPQTVAGQPSAELLQRVWSVCLHQTSYLDRFYSILPGPVRGAKRVIIVHTPQMAEQVPSSWFDDTEAFATTITLAPPRLVY